MAHYGRKLNSLSVHHFGLPIVRALPVNDISDKRSIPISERVSLNGDPTSEPLREESDDQFWVIPKDLSRVSAKLLKERAQ